MAKFSSSHIFWLYGVLPRFFLYSTSIIVFGHTTEYITVVVVPNLAKVVIHTCYNKSLLHSQLECLRLNIGQGSSIFILYQINIVVMLGVALVRTCLLQYVVVISVRYTCFPLHLMFPSANAATPGDLKECYNICAYKTCVSVDTQCHVYNNMSRRVCSFGYISAFFNN